MDRRARILLIDDDPDFLSSTKLVLQNEYDVLTAQSGDEGLRIAEKERPDLILLDVIMPGMDGFAVAERMKQTPELSRVPVLMLTSFAERSGETSIPVSRGFSLEAEDYIDKPVSPDVLLKKVARWLVSKG
jgi:putative two-component system response regulator